MTSQSYLSDNISVVIPVFNSESSLEELIVNLEVVLPNLCPSYELILVNDGSRDQSWQEIQRLKQTRSWVRGINLMRNYGQHNALLCGVRAAIYPVVVTMDDDLQHPPGEIHKLLGELEKGFDVVYGAPHKQRHSLWRNLSSYFTRIAVQTAMGVENARNVSAFRAFRTQVREAFEDYRSPYVILDVLLTWGTTRFSVVEVEHRPRHSGASNYTFKKLVVHAIHMITGFTVLPLQLASMLGFLFAIFGLVVLAYVIGRYLIEGGSVPGFPFLASAVAIFSGVQLFALGIIGEYLARMHFRMMDMPTYVIRDEGNVIKELIDLDE